MFVVLLKNQKTYENATKYKKEISPRTLKKLEKSVDCMQSNCSET